MFITLKPLGERTASATQIIQRLEPKLAHVEGAALFLQPAQDIRVGGRPSRRCSNTHCRMPISTSSTNGRQRFYAKLKALPELTGVATDQQTGGTTLTLTIDRDQAARFGIQPQLIDDTLYDAFGERQVTQYFTQVNSYHVIMEVLPELQNTPHALDHIYIKSPLTGQQVPLSTLVKWTTAPTTFLSINHQGQFPAVTLSFNLAPGVALEAGRDRDPAGGTPNWAFPLRSRHIPGQSAGLPGVARERAIARARGDRRHLPHPGHAL